MKKLLILVIAVTALSMSSASAQAVWGARVGVSKPTLTMSDEEDYKGKFGLELGPVLYYGFKGNWYINTAAMVSFKRLSYEEDWEDEKYSEDLSLIYVDVPVYAGYVIKAGKVSFYAQAGPYAGFKVSEKWKYTEGGKTETDDEKQISVFNYGLGIMGGINIHRFKIEVGYQKGLANIYSSEDEDDFKLKLNSIFLGVSYVF